MDTANVSPVVDYTLVAALAKITRNERGTTKFTFTADIAGNTSAANVVTFALYKNGVATPWKQSITLTSTGTVESVSLPALEYLNGIAEYQMLVSTSTASYAVTFSNVVFVAETVMVWDYI
jgi:hypothetical protein